MPKFKRIGSRAPHHKRKGKLAKRNRLAVIAAKLAAKA